LAFKKASIAIAAVWLAVFASGSLAAAQENNPLTIDIASVDQSTFPTLAAVVGVLDPVGRPVAGLSTANFSATIDGQPATVDGLQTVVDSQASLSVVLAVDASGSMAGEPLAAAQAAAADFINDLSPQDSVAVLSFSDAVTVAQEPTTDKTAAIAALQGLEAVGNTALFEATSRAVAKALESSSPRRVIILLSDGVDYGDKSTVTRDDSVAVARAAGVPLYTIALGADVDRAYLDELAQATRARFLEAPTPTTLSQLYADIAAVLRGQYVVTFAAPGVDPSVPHDLQLSVTVGDASAVASETLAASATAQTPQVTVLGLNAGQELKSAVSVIAQISGGAPTEVRFLVDGAVVATVAAPPYQASLDPAQLGSGDHTLRIEAADAAGLLGSVEVAFASAAPPAAGGSNKPLLLGALLVVVVAAGAFYVVRRRRPRVRRQVVEVRLRPWSNNGAVAGSISLLEDEIMPLPAPESVEKPAGKLIVVNGPEVGREFSVGESPLSIGSAQWCDITFSDTEGRIGAEEARAWVHQDKLIYHKLTRLSLLATDGPTGGWLILEDGDEVDVGAFRLRFISLMPATVEEVTLNEAISEAVQHLGHGPKGTEILRGPVASKLWPMDDPPAGPSDEEEAESLTQQALTAFRPVDGPSDEEEAEPPQAAPGGLWPVDASPTEPSDEQEAESLSQTPSAELWTDDASTPETFADEVPSGSSDETDLSEPSQPFRLHAVDWFQPDPHREEEESDPPAAASSA
jgi:VWFA-related protein